MTGVPDATATPRAWQEVDISSEEWREYHYPDGSTFRIERPTTLYVHGSAAGGITHRVIATEFNITYRPERGWVGISWLPKKGEPAFVA